MVSESAMDSRALSALRALDGGAGERLREILEIFLDDGFGLVLRIEEAIAARNARRLRGYARQLSASGAHVGAAELVAICLELERMGERGRVIEAAIHMDALRKAFDLVEAEIQEHLADGH
ncbi:MAG TPA: Hpt domain-containing protein [Myxococcota bacterium]|nr:Hpt domain-containing protein [Myxococcota bacterium]